MLTVYLDSSDYSVLSRSSLAPGHAETKSALKAFAEKKRVRFVFSGLIVSEMAPLGAVAVPYAIDRGAWLSELCGQNALMHRGDLMKLEVQALARGESPPSTAESTAHDWFPTVELDEPEPLATSVREMIREDATFGRAERRRQERQAFKRGRLRPDVEARIMREAGLRYVDAILSRFPMEPSNAGVLGRYVMGKASRDEAIEALKASLRDPCWVMRWFSENPKMAEPLTDMIREPGRLIGERFRTFVEQAKRLKVMPEAEGNGTLWDQQTLSQTREWGSYVDEVLFGTVKSIAAHCKVDVESALTSEKVASCCPGLNATVRAALSSLRHQLDAKQEPSDSQFPDAMHAIYGPYVDLFRADAFMAPHIQRHLMDCGTKVVSRLVDLPREIEQRLASQGSTAVAPA